MGDLGALAISDHLGAGGARRWPCCGAGTAEARRLAVPVMPVAGVREQIRVLPLRHREALHRPEGKGRRHGQRWADALALLCPHREERRVRPPSRLGRLAAERGPRERRPAALPPRERPWQRLPLSHSLHLVGSALRGLLTSVSPLV